MGFRVWDGELPRAKVDIFPTEARAFLLAQAGE
jgi:hypothetical protein